MLGEGAFGKVLAVMKKDSKKLYAMKKMKKSYIIKTKYIEYIMNERKIMEEACKGHPFLVSLQFVHTNIQQSRHFSFNS